MDPIALVCSVQLELAPLLRRLTEAKLRETPALSFWDGYLQGTRVLALAAGMGKTNAARGLTALVERRPVSGIIGFGVGGAYPGTGLDLGDIAVADAEHYGDEGVDAPTGWISCEGMGIPLLRTEDGAEIYNRFPVDAEAVNAAVGALRRSGRTVEVGPFVTVSTCSGTIARGHQLRDRFDGLCETMEGAAYAHVAALYQIPFLGVRGISNLVEDRDLSRWALDDAAEAAADALPVIARSWPHSTVRNSHRETP